MNVLVLFAHPALERSRVNRRLWQAVAHMPEVTWHDLYEVYPDLNIDVKREQDLLLKHDVILFQSPFYWYSTPAIVKEWQDLVLTHGWAYGAGGTALAGKVTLNVLTAGGPKASYSSSGYNRFTVRQLLSPFEATANLCGMRFLAPFVVHETLLLQGDRDCECAVLDYRRLAESLVRDQLDLERASQVENLHEHLDTLLLPAACVAEGT